VPPPTIRRLLRRVTRTRLGDSAAATDRPDRRVGVDMGGRPLAAGVVRGDPRCGRRRGGVVVGGGVEGAGAAVGDWASTAVDLAVILALCLVSGGATAALLPVFFLLPISVAFQDRPALTAIIGTITALGYLAVWNFWSRFPAMPRRPCRAQGRGFVPVLHPSAKLTEALGRGHLHSCSTGWHQRDVVHAKPFVSRPVRA
jgi:hypothetical protein